MKKVSGIIAVVILILLTLIVSPLSAQTITPDTPSHERPVTAEEDYDFSKVNEKKSENQVLGDEDLMTYALLSLPIVILTVVIVFLAVKRSKKKSQ